MNGILKRTLTIGAAFLLGGATSYAYWLWQFYLLITPAPEWIHPVTRQLSRDERAIVESEVKEWMREPNSAQFRWAQLVIKSPMPRYNVPYCFTVNGHNGFGGYTGPRAAYMTLRLTSEGQVVAARIQFIEGQDPDVQEKCRKVGY